MVLLNNMKQINKYIYERLHINKDIDSHIEYNYHPKTRDELEKLIYKLIKERGNEADLNDIDTSEIKDMYCMFYGSMFNGDISKWDVSNVTDMTCMFEKSKFKGDISNWNVSKVINMERMFRNSEFNGDISNWNVTYVTNMKYMFYDSPLEKNTPKWYKYYK